MKTSQKILLSILTVGLTSAVIGAGTFATFSAQTANGASTFADGTLVLTNTVNSGTACLSTSGGTTDANVNSSCDAVFNASVQKPGQAATVGSIVIKNDGSIPASTLKLSSSTCAASDAATETYHGTGDPCTVVQVTVQEFSDAAMTIPSACRYGGGTAVLCSFDPAKTLATFNGSASPVTIGDLGAGASRYFKLNVQLPLSAGNNMQGRKAVSSFTWLADQ